MEHKVLAHMQARLGPMEAGGFHGWAQLMADGAKFIQKEDIIPAAADRTVFSIAPGVALVPYLIVLTVIPFGQTLYALNLDVGIFFVLAMSSIGVLGVLGPGFATHVLGLSERDFVVVVLPLGLGLVMGILVLNVYGRFFSRRRGIEGGLIALGVTLLALSLAQPIVTNLSLTVSLLSVVIIVAFAAGVAYAFVAVPAQTQLARPSRLQVRPCEQR
jgi:hypothetical protein